MMKKIITITLLVASAFACKENNTPDPQSVIVDTPFTKNALDNYVLKNYTEPYNIGVLYKYLDVESDLNYRLSPSTYESSVRLTTLIKYLCLEPYDKVTGSKEFIKSYFPKTLNYIGSPAYRNNGTMVLGTAEGGRKITMYFTNYIDETTSKNIEALNVYFFRTIHHEFAHILQQTKQMPPAYQEISKGKYIADSWNDEYPSSAAGLTKALSAGFISQYSSKEANEDFVEIVAQYVTSTPEQWQARINPGSAEGKAIINEKLGMVKTYYDSWGVSLDALRDEITKRQANLATFDQTNLN